MFPSNFNRGQTGPSAQGTPGGQSEQNTTAAAMTIGAEQRMHEDSTLKTRILDSTRDLPGTGLTQDEMCDIVARFMAETKPDVDTAWTHLLNAKWNFNVALQAFYDTEPEGSGLTDMEDLQSYLQTADSSSELSDMEGEEEPDEVDNPGTVTDTKTARQAAAVAENPHLDRKPAVLNGGPQPAKLTITLVRNGTRKKFTHQHKVDWTDSKSVHILNRWRAQVFLNGGLPLMRDATIVYERLEEDFIVDFVRQAKLAYDASGSSASFRPNWSELFTQFNDRFEGKMLEGCSMRRPHRSRGSIKTHADRLQAVADIRGVQVRSDAAHRKGKGKGWRKGTGKGKGRAKDDEEEDKDEDEHEDTNEYKDGDED